MNRVQVTSRHLLRRRARGQQHRLNAHAPADTEYKVERARRGPARWYVVQYRQSLPT